MVVDLPLSGTLRDERLPKILTYLQRKKKTGVLVINRNDQNRSIFLKEGDIVFAASKYQDDWLGEMLLKEGRISLSQYEAASEVCREAKKRFGAVLVEQEVVAPKELFSAVTRQVKAIVTSLFTWIDGQYHFEEHPLQSDEVITLKMSTGNLILDGIRRMGDFTRLRNLLPPMNMVLHMTTDPMILFQDIRLSDSERNVLVLVNGRNAISDIFEAAGQSSFETLKLLHFFLEIGLVEVPEAETASAHKIPVNRETAPREAVSREASSNVSDSSPPASDLSDEASEEIFQGVQQEKQEDVEKSRDQIFRKDEEAIHVTQKKIREAYEALATQDHYQVLGLDRDSSRGDIKKAYFRLAKEYHPDRHLQTGMGDLTADLEALFRRITDAYDTLLMEQKRKEYDTELVMKKFEGRRMRWKGGGGGGGVSEKASLGEQALRKGDYKTAIYYLEETVKGAPDKGNLHAFLAEALSHISGRQRDAETHYKRAIEIEPSNVDYYMGLGRLYIRAGMAQRAQRQFEEALLWDPDHPAAKVELNKIKK